jgi:hypothetical protein
MLGRKPSILSSFRVVGTVLAVDEWIRVSRHRAMRIFGGGKSGRAGVVMAEGCSAALGEMLADLGRR